MDYTQFTAVKNRLSKSPNLCDLFKLLSIETWKRLEYAYIKPRVKVFETTLTQNLIFTINAYADQLPLNIEIFEAKDENTNGNDFELIIRYPAENLEYYAPIQAKKVYRNSKYNSMDHGDQILSLINYAKLNRAKAFYLLYNYHSVSAIRPRAVESMGCTLISADYLYQNFYNKRISIGDGGVKRKKWIIPNFNDLNPSPAFPWHDLVCKSSVPDLLRLLSDKAILPMQKLSQGTEISNINQVNSGFFPINTFSRDDDWINLKDLTPRIFDDQKASYRTFASQNRMLEFDDLNTNEGNFRREVVFPNFSPQSRIVITKE